MCVLSVILWCAYSRAHLCVRLYVCGVCVISRLLPTSIVMHISNTAAMPSVPHLYHVGKRIIDMDSSHRQIISHWSSHNNQLHFEDT